ncbi:putative cytoplasmic protein [Escherichia coli TA447]|uniref:Putative cytoplasmic protein n=1 Tax=Escherichia coli TA447 TaxID=656447 RepID=A0A1X3ITM8_ECOLX|nr:putative cytoplasmic protein [Escherichia coli TA447]
MGVKLTETRINTQLSTLNDLICEDGLLTESDSENSPNHAPERHRPQYRHENDRTV